MGIGRTANAQSKMASNPLHLPGTITLAGRKACSFLVSGQQGRVLAPVSKAIYLLTEQDELFWLAGNNVPMHERCAQISTTVPALPFGAPFSVEGSRLIVDGTFAYEIDGCSIWSPPGTTYILEWPEITAHVQAFVLQLDSSQAAGFGNFMPLIQALWLDQPIPGLQYTDPVLQFSQSKVLDLAQACLAQQVEQISDKAKELIGLGSGLTPSGDDFLGGLLFAIKTVQTHYSNFFFPNPAAQIDEFSSQTNPISFVLLSDLANGSAVEPLHEIINGLLGDTAIECISSSVSRLTGVGHSTGWDLLTGLLTGLLTTLQTRTFILSPTELNLKA